MKTLAKPNHLCTIPLFTNKCFVSLYHLHEFINDIQICKNALKFVKMHLYRRNIKHEINALNQ